MATAEFVPPVCLALVGVLFLTCASTGAVGSGFYEVGDEWVYNSAIHIDTVTMNGTEIRCVVGFKTETVAGVTYSAYDFEVVSSLSITGYYDDIAVGGTVTLTGNISVDCETLNEVRSDTNLSIRWSFRYDSTLWSFNTWDRTIISYWPPGGVGEEPGEKTPGDSWVITQTVHVNRTSCDSMGHITASYDIGTQTLVCTYIGRENITVPAGTFDCEVTQFDDGKSIQTTWFSDEVRNLVMHVKERDGDLLRVDTLQSYSFTPDATKGAPMLYVIVGPIVAAAAVVAVFVLIMVKKTRGSPQTAFPPMNDLPGNALPPDQTAPWNPPPEHPPR